MIFQQFTGSGNTLSGRSAKGKEKEQATASSSASTPAASEHNWGNSGNSLGSRPPRDLGPVGAGGARIPRVPQRSRGGKSKEPVKERSPSPDWGVDDDDDVIMIDSD